LSRAFDIYGKRLGLLIGMAAVVYIPAGIIRAVLGQSGLIGSLVATVVSLVAAALYTGAVVRVVQAEDGGSEPGSIGEVFGSVKDRIWPLIWVGIVAGIAMVIGLILFVIPFLILMTIWAVFEPVIVVENKSFDALGRSRELVKGNGWNVFGIIICATLVLLAIGILAGIVGGIIGGVVGLAIAEIIFSVLLVPIAGLIHAVLYFMLAGSSAASEGGAPAPPAAPAV
jgi:hypothetical protein